MSYSNSGTIGTSDAEILISLKPDHKKPTAEYVAELRARLADEFPGTQFFFQPADIVSQILNFGVPAPIDVEITGHDLQQSYKIAQQIANRMEYIPGTVDVHVHQMFEQPTLHLDVNRTKRAIGGAQSK